MSSTSALLTRREAAEIGHVPLNSIGKAIEQGVLKPKHRAASAQSSARRRRIVGVRMQ